MRRYARRRHASLRRRTTYELVDITPFEEPMTAHTELSVHLQSPNIFARFPRVPLPFSRPHGGRRGRRARARRRRRRDSEKKRTAGATDCQAGAACSGCCRAGGAAGPACAPFAGRGGGGGGRASQVIQAGVAVRYARLQPGQLSPGAAHVPASGGAAAAAAVRASAFGSCGDRGPCR